MKLEDGIHDIPNDIYHDSEGISRSGLWEFKRSPLHYWNKYLNPERVKEEPTPQMKLGEYVHALVLEPEYFYERYAVKPVLPELPCVGKLSDLGREEYDRQKTSRESMKVANELTMNEFLESSKGKEIIPADIYNQAKAIADSVLKDEIAQSLFKDVKIEQSIYFTHKHTGLQCKVRPDAWSGSIVTDLKTCADASYRAFQSAAFKGGYFLQAAMIKAALDSIGIHLDKFVFFCVEKTGAMPCVYYMLDDDALAYGMNQFDTLMEQFAYCFENNEWNAYEPQTLYIPGYARYED